MVQSRYLDLFNSDQHSAAVTVFRDRFLIRDGPGAVLPNFDTPQIWPPPAKLGKRGLPDLASPCQIRQTASA